jgi:hypothetical protein
MNDALLGRNSASLTPAVDVVLWDCDIVRFLPRGSSAMTDCLVWVYLLTQKSPIWKNGFSLIFRSSGFINALNTFPVYALKETPLEAQC